MEATWQEQAVALAKEGQSWRGVARAIGKPHSTVSDMLRKALRSSPPPAEVVRHTEQDDKSNERILLISDLHFPYHHTDVFAFLDHLKEKYRPTRVICMGDEVDGHGLSFHEHDPDLNSPGMELQQAKKCIGWLHGMFPVMDILESNHGSLVWRKAKANGIPRHYIKSYNEILGVGSGWSWMYDLTITLPTGQKAYFHHGKSSNVLRLSQMMGMCAVQGHYHESLKIEYWGNPNGLYWGLQTGCLIDDNSLAFAYNNVNIKRPVIGTAVIIEGQPILEPMLLNNKGRWEGHRTLPFLITQH